VNGSASGKSRSAPAGDRNGRSVSVRAPGSIVTIGAAAAMDAIRYQMIEPIPTERFVPILRMSSLMGRTKGPYSAEFPKVTIVKIGDRE
jgi:hypothetical protein